MKLKNRFCSLLFLLSFQFSLFANNLAEQNDYSNSLTTTPSATAPEITLNSSVSFEINTKYPKADFAFNAGCEFAFSNFLRLTPEFSIQKDLYDFSTSIVYVPFVTQTIDLGIKTIVHLQKSPEFYTDSDFLFGAYLCYQPSPNFLMDFSAFYFLKATQILPKQNAPEKIYTHNPAFDLNFCWLNFTPLDLGFELSSFTSTKYNNFFTPVYTFYANYNLSSSCTFNFETQLYYIDMFTLSANLNSISFTAGIDWRLK